MENLENRVVRLETTIEEHSKDIAELKTSGRELSIALQENTKAQIENTITLKEHKNIEDERYSRSIKLMEEFSKKLESEISKKTLSIPNLTKKGIIYILGFILGGVLAYVFNF